LNDVIVWIELIKLHCVIVFIVIGVPVYSFRSQSVRHSHVSADCDDIVHIALLVRVRTVIVIPRSIRLFITSAYIT